MKIREVRVNKRKRCFEVLLGGKWMDYPFARLRPEYKGEFDFKKVYVDPELAREAFTCLMESGEELSIVDDQVLEYNRDPGYLRNMLLYRMTVEAQKLIAASSLKKREIIRRLRTSPTQFYRLVDQTNYRKTIDQMVRLLAALECEVAVTFRKAA